MQGTFARRMKCSPPKVNLMTDRSLLKMIGITKKFPGVVANDKVGFELHAGEIHSLLGENGAGKTTLMNILAGMCQPDQGTIMVGGQTVRIRSPRHSLKLGIGMVYQHFTLIPNLTVLENLMLGFEGGFLLNLKEAQRKLQQISGVYGLSIDSQSMIQDLSVAERQRTEILKILFHESNILILDEPTSILSPIEARNLYHTLNLLRNTKKSVILITHNLKEALAVSDRITIMRSGRRIAEFKAETISAMGSKAAADKILGLMFKTIPRTASSGVEAVSSVDPLLELKNVAVLNHRGQIGLKQISLGVGRGEIVGITGVGGEDQRLLAEVIGGQTKVRSGSLIYRGRDISRMDIAQRFELGICYISADRINEGCVADMTLSENAVLQNYSRPPFSKFGLISQTHISSFARGLINRFGIRATGPAAALSTLSGGNIQKLILARGFAGKPDLIVCNSPTYGLDAKTVCFIQDLLKKESRRGAAVLLITSDMDELFSCSNRIGVIFKGQLIGLMDRCEASIEKVGNLMLGVNG
jgi:simple sugar transport system ATP-binding protein